MNYYIDFDHTLFNTSVLTQRMLETISKNAKIDIEECKSMFNRNNFYNIYELISYFSEKYDLDKIPITLEVDKVINNCSDLVFEDGIDFIKQIKQKGNKVYLLSYYEFGLQYQLAKILGSKISNLFNEVIITSDLKYNLNIDYSNGIFIDDKPQDLLGLYSKNPYKVIRLKRKGHKYSIQKLSNSNIIEYEDFRAIPIE